MEGNEQLAVIIPMLKSIAGRIEPKQLANPTPCALFDVAGVLSHMTGLASGFAPMFRGDNPEPSITSTPAAPTTPTVEFNRAMDELLAAVSSRGALERTIQTPGGPMPGAVFARLVAFDGLVHGWDLAISTQQDWLPPEQLVSEVDSFAREAITETMRNDGDSFAPEKAPPTNASPMLRLVAFTGRVI